MSKSIPSVQANGHRSSGGALQTAQTPMSVKTPVTTHKATSNATKQPPTPTYPRAYPRPSLSQATAFWEQVDKTSSSYGCWELKPYQAHRRSTMSMPRLNRLKLHTTPIRFAYAATYGDVPAGRFVVRRCQNECCVRPDHLYLSSWAGGEGTQNKLGKTGKATATAKTRATLTRPVGAAYPGHVTAEYLAGLRGEATQPTPKPRVRKRVSAPEAFAPISPAPVPVAETKPLLVETTWDFRTRMVVGLWTVLLVAILFFDLVLLRK